MLAGTFFKAEPLLDGTFFEGAVIFIYQDDENGAVGVVVNKRFERTLDELVEFAYSRPVTLYDGGPVDREHIFLLHRVPSQIRGGKKVTGDVWFGCDDFASVVELLNDGRISNNDLRLFIGYCGWDKGELEAEIEEGSWRPVEHRQLFE